MVIVPWKKFVKVASLFWPGALVLAAASLLVWGCAPGGQTETTTGFRTESTPGVRPGVVSRLSASPQYGGANGASHDASITPDGRFAVFNSEASNLLGPGGDTNGVADIYLKDMQSGSLTRVSTTATGDQVDGDSHSPSISDDGRFVVFISTASNLVPGGHTNGLHDIYLKDLQTGSVRLISANSAGAPAVGGISDIPTISADGRYIAFCSEATNLVPDDTNGVMDVFWVDTFAGTIIRLSTSSEGGQGNGASGATYGPYLSGNGRFVAFESDADNLIGAGADTNHVKDIFVKEVATGVITRVSTTSTGAEADSSSHFPSLSADGRFVLFRSHASNLAEGDTLRCESTNCSDVFRKDTLTGAVYWASTTSAGEPADQPSWEPHISTDGRYAAFSSSASNLAAGDGNDNYDIFVKDMETGRVVLASRSADGHDGNDWSIGPFVGQGGAYVAFESMASNLTADNDTNNATDAFLAATGFTRPATEVSPDA